jgi:hypothetical protein
MAFRQTLGADTRGSGGSAQVSGRDSWHVGCLSVAAGNAFILLGGSGEDLLVISLLTQR